MLESIKFFVNDIIHNYTYFLDNGYNILNNNISHYIVLFMLGIILLLMGQYSFNLYKYYRKNPNFKSLSKKMIKLFGISVLMIIIYYQFSVGNNGKIKIVTADCYDNSYIGNITNNTINWKLVHNLIQVNNILENKITDSEKTLFCRINNNNKINVKKINVEFVYNDNLQLKEADFKKERLYNTLIKINNNIKEIKKDNTTYKIYDLYNLTDLVDTENSILYKKDTLNYYISAYFINNGKLFVGIIINPVYDYYYKNVFKDGKKDFFNIKYEDNFLDKLFLKTIDIKDFLIVYSTINNSIKFKLYDNYEDFKEESNNYILLEDVFTFYTYLKDNKNNKINGIGLNYLPGNNYIKLKADNKILPLDLKENSAYYLYDEDSIIKPYNGNFIIQNTLLIVFKIISYLSLIGLFFFIKEIL